MCGEIKLSHLSDGSEKPLVTSSCIMFESGEEDPETKLQPKEDFDVNNDSKFGLYLTQYYNYL